MVVLSHDPLHGQVTAQNALWHCLLGRNPEAARPPAAGRFPHS